MGIKVSVLLPSMGRPKLLRQAITSLYDTTIGYEIECVVCIDEDEDSYNLVCDLQFQLPESFEIVPDWSKTRRGAIKAWNDALALSSGDHIFPMGDDGLCHPKWLDYALETHHDKLSGYGCVGLNDLNIPEATGVFTTLFYDRKFCVDYFGGVCAIPKYNYLWIDVELCERARRVNKLVYDKRGVVEHLHCSNGKRPQDSFDDEKMNNDWFTIDKVIFENRKSNNFPDDFSPVITE